MKPTHYILLLCPPGVDETLLGMLVFTGLGHKLISQQETCEFSGLCLARAEVAVTSVPEGPARLVLAIHVHSHHVMRRTHGTNIRSPGFAKTMCSYA